GRYQGPILIDKPIKLIGEPGAVLVAGPGQPGILIANTSDVTIAGLTVEGGSEGVWVEHATEVALERISASGARLHGIFTRDAHVEVIDCHVWGLRSPLAQGVEITNSVGRAVSVVQGCRVEGPVFEGIVSHVSPVRFSDNHVSGSTERGVVITEMSHGRMQANTVTDSSGAAFFCGDMSRCSVVSNRAIDIDATDTQWRSTAGHGLVVHYHSYAYVEGLDTVRISGDHTELLISSVLLSRPPDLEQVEPEGALLLTVVAFLVLALPVLAGWGGRWPALMLVAALAVQGVHQIEHLIQVVQAKMLGSKNAHGLAGAAFDIEWVHLAFNGVLWAALALAVAGYGRERLASQRKPRPAGFWALGAGLALQSYHLVEHLLKIHQHVTWGLTPAPGILGHSLDLVWLHFGINLAVLALVGWGAYRLRILTEMAPRRPVPAPQTA
ncbi:MAG: right-handed parallel beta-helix repeat-containing protein, partial [Acidimicrobiia bacterium]